jgi:hypothetical protein
MEIYIITVSNPRDRDLILGFSSSTLRLTYTEAAAIEEPALNTKGKGCSI